MSEAVHADDSVQERTRTGRATEIGREHGRQLRVPSETRVQFTPWSPRMRGIHNYYAHNLTKSCFTCLCFSFHFTRVEIFASLFLD